MNMYNILYTYAHTHNSWLKEKHHSVHINCLLYWLLKFPRVNSNLLYESTSILIPTSEIFRPAYHTYSMTILTQSTNNPPLATSDLYFVILSYCFL